MVDLSVLTVSGKALFLAYDQGLEHGPTDFTDANIDPNSILEIASRGGYTGVILQKGIAEKYYTKHSLAKNIPLILKLNGKTNLVVDKEPYSPQICSVEEAVSLGAKAVGYTIYVGSEYEERMFSEFAAIEEDAHKEGLPIVAWMYPRGKATIGKDKEELCAYGARVGLELGADIIKLQYPGSIEALSWAVKAAGEAKIVVSGGHKMPEEDFFLLAHDVVEAGAIGMAVGRNIWQHKDPLAFSKKVRDSIFTK